MNASPRRAACLCSSLLLASLLSQCAMAPPYIPPNAGGGYSLDSAPGSRSRQQNRYLENTMPPPMPDPGTGGTALSNAPVYETPETITTTPPAPEQTPPVTTPPPDTTTTASEPPAPNPPAGAAPEQMPFGLPVPGKKGFVYSPFDKTQMVDVRGIPPGKKVRCPYTSKIFLVP